MLAQSCDQINESFESGFTPVGWVNTNGVYFNATNSNTGVNKSGFNAAGEMLQISPQNCPGEVCFYWRASGFTSNFDVTIEWSDDNGATWNTQSTILTNGSGSPTVYAQDCVNLPEATYATPNGILIRFNMTRRVSGSFFLDDVCVSSGTCSVVPTKFTFTSITSSCIDKNNNFSVTICATDNSGNVDNTFTGSVTVSKNSGPGILSGTVTKSFVNGCISYTNLSFNQAGTYTLAANDGTLTGTSSNITVVEDCALQDSIVVMSYNLLNFPDGRNDCGANVVVPERYDTLRKIVQYIKPDAFMVCELQNSKGADSIITRSLNVFGTTSYAAANFVTNTSGGPQLQSMFFYNTAKLRYKSQTEIVTDLRDINVYKMYGNDPNIATHNDTTFIYFYVGHLKAGNTAPDATRRQMEADSIRKYVNAQPANINHVLGGDFNFYMDTEAGYTILTSGGPTPFKDPINRPGSWTSNPAFADIHTQSTRLSTSMDCGAMGGMDDRFDFILLSDSVLTGGNRVRYKINSYTALGNDGLHYNAPINGFPANTSAPDSVIQALWTMSDHLPVYLKLLINYPTISTITFTSVITHVNCPCELTGSITLTPSSGISPYTYKWSTGATTQTISGLAGGNYSFTVYDAVNDSAYSTLTVNEPSPIVITLNTQTNVSCFGDCNGAINVQATGGTPLYDFSKDGGTTWTFTGISSATPVNFSGLCNGTYTIVLRDQNGCVTPP